jgi:DNA-nicking Smr family endonuclease
VAGRRLSSEEAALWRQVSGSVRPLSDRIPLPIEGGAKGGAAPLKMTPSLIPAIAHPRPLPVAGGEKRPSNTLDGSWDRRIGTGQLTPERTIDLHGYNLASAHHRLDRALEEAVRDGVRVILIVTGRASRSGGSRIDLPMRGIIRESIGDWLAVSRHKSAIAAVRNAHPRHGGAGALYLILRRSR